MSVGWPAHLWLNEFGAMLHSAFGATAYQVGSSIDSKQWRDVDVVLIMSDELHEQWFGPYDRVSQNGTHHVLTLAMCELGKRVTGLNIDFKFQQQTHANEQHKGARNALICTPNRGTRWSE